MGYAVMSLIRLYRKHRNYAGTPGLIQRELGTLPISADKWRDCDIVLNWGRSTPPPYYDNVIRSGVRWLNTPQAVSVSSDKVKTLQACQDRGISCLTFTEQMSTAQAWVDDGEIVYERHLSRGSRGRGIRLADYGHVRPAPLYTMHYAATHEFRVGVTCGQITNYVQKKRMGTEKLAALGLEQADPMIRNHERGWVFCRHGIHRFLEVEQLAIDAVSAVGLDFGAVDILAIVHEDGSLINASVCEVNSAMGMEGTTLSNFINVVTLL